MRGDGFGKPPRLSQEEGGRQASDSGPGVVLASPASPAGAVKSEGPEM